MFPSNIHFPIRRLSWRSANEDALVKSGPKTPTAVSQKSSPQVDASGFSARRSFNSSKFSTAFSPTSIHQPQPGFSHVNPSSTHSSSRQHLPSTHSSSQGNNKITPASKEGSVKSRSEMSAATNKENSPPVDTGVFGVNCSVNSSQSSRRYSPTFAPPRHPASSHYHPSSVHSSSQRHGDESVYSSPRSCNTNTPAPQQRPDISIQTSGLQINPDVYNPKSSPIIGSQQSWTRPTASTQKQPFQESPRNQPFGIPGPLLTRKSFSTSPVESSAFNPAKLIDFTNAPLGQSCPRTSPGSSFKPRSGSTAGVTRTQVSTPGLSHYSDLYTPRRSPVVNSRQPTPRHTGSSPQEQHRPSPVVPDARSL